MATKDKAKAASGGRKLTPKQALFAKEYLIDLNATQAAIRAGYSAKTAQAQGGRLLLNVMVQNLIREGQSKRADSLEINAEYVLKRLVEIDQMDALDILNEDGTLKPISQWPKVWRRYLSGLDIMEMSAGGDSDNLAFIKKIKWPDKVKNLELIGKHVNIQAFSDKVIHAGDQNNPITHSVATKEELREIAKGLASKV